MSIGVKWADSYSPAQATRSSWIPLDMSTVTAYPTAGSGKMAQLNYIVGMDSSTPGASSTSPSYVQIVDAEGDAVTVSNNGYLNVRIAESVTILSAFEIDTTGISGLQIRAEVEYPDTSIYVSNGAILANNVSSYNFGQNIQSIEIFNLESNNTVYMSYNTNNLNTISAVGMPILGESYYSMDREGQYVYIANPNGTPSDVRVVGHYRA